MNKPDLASVLDYYNVQYSPSRRSQKILCPVHEERVPSCSIDLTENLFNCHACKSQGDSITLIQEKERCSFTEALQIAERLGLPNMKKEESTPGLFGRKHSSRPARRAPYRPKLYDR